MNTIGFIGLGIMGHGMANNLLKAGFSLSVWNRTREKANDLVERGAQLTASPAEVADGADVIITMLSADEQVKEILLGEKGVIKQVTPGQIVMDSSTVSPETSRELHTAFANKEVDFLDAPVTGSAPQAEEGILGFMVGGSKEAFNQCQEVFKAMGKSWIHMGVSGAGSTTKLANNTMGAINMLAVAEGLSIAKQGGVNVEDFIRVVSSGGAHSRMVDMKAPKMIENDTASVQFAAQLMNKDLKLAAQMAEQLGVSTPILGMAKQILRMAVSKGYGEEDMSAVYKLYQEWSEQQAEK